VWSDCPTPEGSDCLNMKTFLGRIVTVSDGAGRNVTVSNWGVAQSSRHRRGSSTMDIRKLNMEMLWNLEVSEIHCHVR
jgi:hypothetical protein